MERTIEGKSSIKATVVCDSVSSVNGKRITTFSLEYPRLIHSEFMTHRMFSRNAASSRAIPFDKMVDNLKGIPVRFGAANKGMQDKGEEHTKEVEWLDWDYQQYNLTPVEAWEKAKTDAIGIAEAFRDAGYHKQIYNRLLEPFQMMKTIVTATEWSNFFWLRDDEAADPTIQELARCMKEAMEQSEPTMLFPGEWHLPFVETLSMHEDSEDCVYILNDKEISLEDAIIVSCARCAAVSFRNNDYDLAKCRQVYDRLINAGKVHGSALEHCATPMEGYDTNDTGDSNSWQVGITHVDKSGVFYSGNFQSWIQYRQLIPNESKKG